MADWLAAGRADLAREQLVDAAAGLFAERGVAAVGMGDVARAAGCSRATLYRYFPTRDDLRLAFVDREARRVAAEVATAVDGVEDQGERVQEAVVAALAAVRADATLSSWFRAENAGAAVAAAHASTVVERVAAAFLGADGGDGARAEWLVRAIVSLLLVPGADPAAERSLIRRAVVPVVVAR